VRDAGNTIVPNPQNFAWSLKNPALLRRLAPRRPGTGNSNTGTDTIWWWPAASRHGSARRAQVLATIAVTPATPAPLNFVGDTQSFAAEPRDSAVRQSRVKRSSGRQ